MSGVMAYPRDYLAGTVLAGSSKILLSETCHPPRNIKERDGQGEVVQIILDVVDDGEFRRQRL
jgi:hypothetical protein